MTVALMQRQRVKIGCVLLTLMLLSPLLFALSIETALNAQEGFNWVFSGMVSNEQGERYGYYFEIQKQGEHCRILSALVNMEHKSLVFVEENEEKLATASALTWQIGRSYLGYNPVTHRLAFGVITPTHTGFGFKIDTLAEPVFETKPQSIRTGLALNVSQMGRLNGHVYLGTGHTDEFVTAKQTWFRQLTSQASTHTGKNHDLTDVLCQFDDGSGFYAIHLPEPDALRGFIAGWRDPSGKSVKMSQFVNIKQDVPHEWDLSTSLPAMHVRFSDLLEKHRAVGEIAAGVVIGSRSGFCTAAKERV